MKTKIYFSIGFTFLFFLQTLCQNEDKVWYFGSFGTGLDFRNCTPVVKNNGYNVNVNYEGATSICDATSGRLLFYCAGMKIIDSTFNVMPNGGGIGNGYSNTQSLIVKKPGSSNLFYVIIPDCQGGIFGGTVRGIKYAIVDMNQNSGKGDVVSFNNKIKDSANCEMITAVRHSNGSDIWVICHEYRTNNFLVYSLTSAGLNTIAAVCGVGPVVSTPGSSNLETIGEIKASPDGNHLAFTSLISGQVCIFDFNKGTGAISNPIQLTSITGYSGYGVSFSPDCKKLYVSCIASPLTSITNGKLIQYDLSIWNQTSIQNSLYTVHTATACSFRSIKLAPNGKIYAARVAASTHPDWGSLVVINNPNGAGASCNYAHNGLVLGGANSWGLNNSIESSTFCCTQPTFTLSASQNPICLGSSVTISAVGASFYTLNAIGFNNNVVVNPISTTTYTVLGANNESCSAKSALTISVSICEGTNQKESDLGDYLIEVFPNPTSNNITIETSMKNYLIILTNSLGKCVLKQSNNLKYVNLSDFEPGVYYLKIMGDKSTFNTKIVFNP